MTPRYTDRPRAFRPQRPTEGLDTYRGRLLRYALIAGIHTLTPAQRGQVETAAMRAACQVRNADGQAQRLDAAQLAILARLTDLRHQIAQLDRWEAQQAQATGSQAQARPPAAPSSQERPGDGNRGARLTPPTPTRPPSGSAVAYAPPPALGVNF